MMKTHIKAASAAVATSKYPRLMELKASWAREVQYVVLFTAPENGVVVTAEGEYALGHKSTTWVESRFKPFHGTVELVNE